jgi:hypothetical protein
VTQTSSSTAEIIAPTAHSSIVGGSNAGKRIACPASYSMELKLPDAIKNASSSYADEGSACHAAMAEILEKDISDPYELEGRTYEGLEGYPMTKALIAEALVPCVDFFDELCDQAEAEGGLSFLVEKRCELRTIPEAFGTSDLIARTDKRSIILDWKFGAGVPVFAFYEDEMPDGAIVITPNAQLCFYAKAAMFTHPEMFETDPDWRIEIIIAQPRLRDGALFDRHTITVRELEDFHRKLLMAVAEAKSDSPRRKRGEHCRFAACKAICPEWTKPVFDMDKLGAQLEKAKSKAIEGEIEILTTPEAERWGLTYSEMLQLADLVEPLIKEWRSQAHTFMESGGKVPLYKLVPKRATEKYVGDDKALLAANMVVEHGAKVEDVYEPKTVKSPAQLRSVLEPLVPGKTKKEREALAKKKIADYTASVSSGTTLAPEDDKRPSVITTGDVIKSLGDRLAALK